MKTISEAVEETIKQSPFMEDFLIDGIINLTALARKIKPEIEMHLGKEVQQGAMVMALKRFNPQLNISTKKKINKFMSNLGAITVRSNLNDYAFTNSASLAKNQTTLLSKISDNKEVFYALSMGTHETTIVISASQSDLVNELFKKETRLSIKQNLSSISIKLPTQLYDTPGVYFYMLQKIAWAGINVIDVISTIYEFTIIVEDVDVGNTFNILNDLKKLGI
ncbi:MAG: aspartate kinase [Bacteroidia bacterium]|nr:aspartate kinase [Bacteroidia bacterium]